MKTPPLVIALLATTCLCLPGLADEKDKLADEKDKQPSTPSATLKGRAQGKDKGGPSAKKSTVSERVYLEKLGAKLKQAVANGEMTGEEAEQEWLKAAASKKGRPKAMMKRGRTTTFYAIVIGRLKSKDIELGEFTLEVDHVTSIYGDRSLKKTLVGKTVKVVGISGELIDRLLLFKRGETIEFRSGTLHGTTISLSPKATVLERAVPFDPEVYPIPPEEFRGFQGVVTGTITSKSDQGYELTLRVGSVDESFDDSAAEKPESIEGKLVDMRGFYDRQFRAKFDDLRIGDKIRVGAAHRDRTVDALEVSRILEKVAP